MRSLPPGLGLALATWLIGCQLAPPQGTPSSPTAPFETILATLQSESIEFERRGLDAESLRKRVGDRLSSDGDLASSIRGLARWLSELEDPHLTYLPPGVRGGRRLTRNFVCLGDRWRVLPSSLTEPADLPPLMAIDGIEVRRANLGALVPALAHPALDGPPRLDVLDASGDVVPLSPGPEPGTGRARRRDETFWIDRWLRLERRGDLGYLRILTFSSEQADLEPSRMTIELQAALDQLEGCRRLILDLQSNPGGDLDLGLTLVRRLYRGPPATWMEVSDVRRLIPRRTGAPFQLVILADEATGSTAEHVIAHLSRSPDVTLIGARTSGSQFSLAEMRTPDGTVLKYSSRRVRFPDSGDFQGRGLEPDVRIPFQIEPCRANGFVEALRSTRLARLEAALTILGEPAAARPAPWYDLIFGRR